MNCHQQQSQRKASRCEPESWPSTGCGQCQHPLWPDKSVARTQLVRREQQYVEKPGRQPDLGHVVNTTLSHE